MKNAALVFGILSLVVSACGGSQKVVPPGIIDITPQEFTEREMDLYCGTVPREDCELPAPYEFSFDLIDHNNQPITGDTHQGKVQFVYFGFATCPDVCPAALGVMSSALDSLGREADEIQPLFITVDPERDTPEALKTHLSFDERILGVTGDPQAVDGLRGRMKVYAQKVPLPDSALEYTVDHQDFFFIIGRDGQPLRAVEGHTNPVDVADVLSQAVRGTL